MVHSTNFSIEGELDIKGLRPLDDSLRRLRADGLMHTIRRYK